MRKKSKNKYEKHKKSFLLKVMKGYLVFFTLSFFCSLSAVNLSSQNANITLKLTNSNIKVLFSEIEKNTDYAILYRKEITKDKKVSVDAKNKSVKEVLDQVLPPLDLKYYFEGKQIVVLEDKKDNNNQGTKQSSPSFKLTGTVVDERGETLIGVPITVKGLNIGVVTDVDGKFSIDVSPGYTLVIKYVGYKTQEILVTADKKEIHVKMQEDVTELKDIVVVGYGTQKKSSMVGSVQSVNPGELKVPSTQLSTSFAGKLAGVVAVQRSGEPGADGANFWIRGISTFNGTTSPLIIMDGVQVSSGDLNNIDPEVIESFSILKDATATALYGTRGGNGVMIITTKRGKNLDKPMINARLEASVTTPTKKPKTVDAVTYMNMFNESLGMGRGLRDPYSADQIAGTAAGLDGLLYPNVDWYDEMFNNSAMTEKALFNIRGGGAKIDYFMNVSINHENSFLKNRSKDFYSFDNDINLWRYNFQNNITITASPSTSIALRLNTQIYDYNGPHSSADDLYNRVMRSNPVDFPVLFPANDSRNQSPRQEHILWGGKTGGTQNSGYPNPVAELSKGYKSKSSSTVIANLELNQKLDFVLDGLSFNGLISFKNWTDSQVERSISYNTYYLTNPLMAGNKLDSYELQRIGGLMETALETKATTYGDSRLYIEGRLHYDQVFNSVHNVAAMFLYNQDEYKDTSPGNQDTSMKKLLASLPKRRQGLAGRLSYAYDSRYLAEVNFGYNGSENFADGNRWGFFPSFAVGYVMSQESYWDKIRPVISHLKLRGSYGLKGNDQIGAERFIYMSELDLKHGDRNFVTGVDQETGVNGPKYSRYGNKDITWEVGYQYNVGLDMQLFNDINIMVDAFREIRKNIFLERQTIPNYMGTGDIKSYGNLGEVRNHGFDFAIDYNKQFTKDLFVSFKGTFTFAANKIRKYDEPGFRLYPNLSRVGHSVNQQLMYIADRLFVDDAEVANSAKQQLGGVIQGGDIKYIDQADRYGNMDGQIDGSDRLYYGHPTVPEIVYGFGPSIMWKKWDFSFFFQGVGRTSLMMSGFHPFGTQSINNVLQFVADDYWSLTNQNIYASYPRLSQIDNANNTQNSTYWLRDASFLKLKNAEIGYTHNKYLRVYASGTNLLTFSKFKHWDPEQGGGAGFKYPTTRVFNVGVQVSL